MGGGERRGGEGRGGALDMGFAPPPLETSSGSAPVNSGSLPLRGNPAGNPINIMSM